MILRKEIFMSGHSCGGKPQKVKFSLEANYKDKKTHK